eukprot:TRINITY_DN1353_c0_g1_i1.p1 TRINITY_DN1353_c0_g1~~TRINITY_DN1353_c0_g1_i1.p1  ORF type:complete len:267 (-),score=60.80 TRINITY_DN1353_c0_g1_i1:123-923(-)
MSSWSRTLSVSYMLVADTRDSPVSYATKSKAVNIIASKFEDNTLEIPYNEFVVRHLQFRNMRNPYIERTSPRRINVNVEVSPAKKKASPERTEKGDSKLETSFDKRKYKADAFQEKFGSQQKQRQPLTSTTTTRRVVKKEPLPQKPRLNLKPSTLGKVDSNLAPKRSPSKTKVEQDKGPIRVKVTSMREENKEPPEFGTSPFRSRVRVPDNSETIENPELEAFLRNVKKRMAILMKTPRELWTKSDYDLIKFASDPKIGGLLETID